jgi:hypothetical protein
MAAEAGAAALDRTHHLHLVAADVPGIGTTPSGSVVAKISATSRAGRDMAAAVTPAAGLFCSSWA